MSQTTSDTTAVDDAYGGYRGMWRNAEDAELRAERDRYREALTRIYQRATGPLLEIAREALNG